MATSRARRRFTDELVELTNRHDDIDLEELEQAIKCLREVAVETRIRKGREAMASTATVSVGEILARSIRQARQLADVTQTQLADAMNRLGFVGWKRITVAETESGKRRPSWEELLGLCALFGTDVTGMLTAVGEDENVRLNEREVLTAAEYSYLTTNFSEPGHFGLTIDGENPGSLSLTGVDAAGDDADWRPVARWLRQDTEVNR